MYFALRKSPCRTDSLSNDVPREIKSAHVVPEAARGGNGPFQLCGRRRSLRLNGASEPPSGSVDRLAWCLKEARFVGRGGLLAL